MTAPHRILNVTLIRHPALDEAAGQRALARVAQVAEATWGPLANASGHRLSPGALQWRAEGAIRDTDTPEARGAAMMRVLEALRDSLRTDPLDAEAAGLLRRAEIIGSGHTGKALHWGVTLGLHEGLPTTMRVQFLTRQPAITLEPAPVGAVCQDILAATRAPSPEEAPVARVRSRRTP